MLVLYKRFALVLVVALVIGFSLGVARGMQASGSALIVEPFYGKKIVVVGRVVDDPSYADHGQTEVYLSTATIQGGPKIAGKVRVRGYALNLNRGDTVRVEGKLYDGFGSYSASMYYAQITVLQHDEGWAHAVRSRFRTGLLNSLPEPSASLAFGLLVGAKSGLSADLATRLSIVGLTHLVAVSGYNLTIIIRATRRLFVKLSPRISLVFSLLLIVGFLLVTGFSASIVRAAVVSLLSLAAWYFGREPKPAVLLLLAAAITCLLNPMYVRGDIGWYLSFLAFFGILILAPLVSSRLWKSPKLWQQVLVESTAAVVMTAPLIAYTFGRLSIIAPLANMLILPFIPLTMLLSFVAGLTGMISPLFSSFIALPARLMLWLIVKVVEQLSAISWASTSISVSSVQMLALYAGIAGITVALYLKQGSSRDTMHVVKRKNVHVRT